MPKVGKGIDTGSPKCSIGIDELYERTSDEDIVRFYFNVTKIPCVIRSPLREDKNPSFGFYYGHNDKVRFIDYANKDVRGDVLDLLQLYFKKPLYAVIDKVYNEDLDEIGNKHKEENNILLFSGGKPSAKPKAASRKEIDIITRKAEQYDYEYWGQYGIDKKWLVNGDVFPISHVMYYDKDNNKTTTVSVEKYSYAYRECKDGITTYKVYRPFNEKYKWSNDCNSSIWELWSKLPPTGEKLIITSSRKDALCIWANVGIPSVSLQSEATLPKPHIIQELKDRFDKIYVLYDNDETGKKYSEKFCELFNTIKIEIPIEYECKDPSDLYKEKGKEVFINVIKVLTE
jgi:hypothetical protein